MVPLPRFYTQRSTSNHEVNWEIHDRELGGQSYMGRIYDPDLANRIEKLLNEDEEAKNEPG